MCSSFTLVGVFMCCTIFSLRKAEKVPITAQCRLVSLVTFAVRCVSCLFFSVISSVRVFSGVVLWLTWRPCGQCGKTARVSFNNMNLFSALLHSGELCRPACPQPLCVVGSLGSEFIWLQWSERVICAWKQPTLPLNIVIYSTPLIMFLKGFCAELSVAKRSSESQLWDQPG